MNINPPLVSWVPLEIVQIMINTEVSRVYQGVNTKLKTLE